MMRKASSPQPSPLKGHRSKEREKKKNVLLFAIYLSALFALPFGEGWEGSKEETPVYDLRWNMFPEELWLNESCGLYSPLFRNKGGI